MSNQPNSKPQYDIDNLPPPSKYPGPKGIPIEAIIELKEKNLSDSQVAKILNCHPSNITRRRQEIEITKKYVNHRGVLLDHLERKIYNSITDAKLKKANLNQSVWSFGVIYDKGRLERGESTQILGYADAIKARDGVKITLEEIKRVIIERQSGSDNNIVENSPTLDSQGIEEIEECG